MALPSKLANFDIENSSITVWLFKKSLGPKGGGPKYTGKWIVTHPDLDAALRVSVADARAKILEVKDYDLLAQNNEASALMIDTAETYASAIVDNSKDPLSNKKVKSQKDIANTDFFVVRLSVGDDTLHAVRRTDTSWKTKKRKELIDLIFRENALELDASPSFSLRRDVDFFILGEDILIRNKANFETILSYRQAHANEFSEMQKEAEFLTVFSEVGSLVEFVGDNKIQLRRMCSIRQKGHYKNEDFLRRLREKHRTYGLTLQFSPEGRIVPTLETCRDIIIALLDHRLSSAFSDLTYDVPEATRIT